MRAVHAQVEQKPEFGAHEKSVPALEMMLVSAELLPVVERNSRKPTSGTDESTIEGYLERRRCSPTHTGAEYE